jgi:leucyl aminopeptidase
MHRAALVALLLASGTAAAEPRYISIGGDVLGALSPSAQFVDTNGGVAVVRIDDDELPDLAEAIHEQTGRCGGFIVHDSLADAESALEIQRDRPAPPIEYTIDRPHAVRSVLPLLDKATLLATIRELSAMPNRFYKSEAGAAASLWLRDRWQSFVHRDDVSIELVSHAGWPQQSVVLTIRGTTRASETVVIGGHLDSISFGAKGAAPGADDDASGIATMTEVIRALLAADYRPERTLVFVAYAAEEVGLRGSQDIVKLFKQRGIDVVGALQLDMTNYQGSAKDIWLMKDFTSAAQNEFVTKLIDTYVGATWGLDACGYGCSDHASWYRAGVPASMPFEARMKDRNMKIHTASDTLETSGNNADHAIKFARLAVAYAIELGKGGVPEDDDTSRGLLALGLLVAAAALARRFTT